ncbi:MAG: hypothetical protein CL596_04920 [Alteromonas sp.]|nr:hypothetical protein [Alteromonas sp.]
MISLNKNIKKKLHQYLKQRLGMYDYRRGWLKGNCPYCGAHKFGVNLGQSRSNCFKCENHPSLFQLVMDLEYLSTIPEVLTYLNTFEGVDFYEELVEPHELKKDITLPEGYRNIKRGNNTLARAARNYVKNRGFDIDFVSLKGWGYCDRGKYFGYLIMPFYMKGKVCYFNARLFLGNGPKFNNPLVEDFGLGKSMLIYNIDALFLYKTIYAFESVTNATTIGDNAIGLGGKKISTWQKNIIIKSPCEKVIIGLDDDAIDDAIKLAFELVDYKKVKILEFPYKKDANDMGRKKTLKLSHTSRYLKYGDIITLKNNMYN